MEVQPNSVSHATQSGRISFSPRRPQIKASLSLCQEELKRGSYLFERTPNARNGEPLSLNLNPQMNIRSRKQFKKPIKPNQNNVTTSSSVKGISSCSKHLMSNICHIQQLRFSNGFKKEQQQSLRQIRMTDPSFHGPQQPLSLNQSKPKTINLKEMGLFKENDSKMQNIERIKEIYSPASEKDQSIHRNIGRLALFRNQKRKNELSFNSAQGHHGNQQSQDQEYTTHIKNRINNQQKQLEKLTSEKAADSERLKLFEKVVSSQRIYIEIIEKQLRKSNSSIRSESSSSHKFRFDDRESQPCHQTTTCSNSLTKISKTLNSFERSLKSFSTQSQAIRLSIPSPTSMGQGDANPSFNLQAQKLDYSFHHINDSPENIESNRSNQELIALESEEIKITPQHSIGSAKKKRLTSYNNTNISLRGRISLDIVREVA